MAQESLKEFRLAHLFGRGVFLILSHMDKLKSIIQRLNEIVSMENNQPLDQLGSYLIGTLVVDDEADKLCETNETLARIAELGGDLETSNGGSEWMQKNWQEVKALVEELNQKNT